jgi:Family of unknown function (DUF5763)
MFFNNRMLKILALLLLSVSLKGQMVFKTPSGAKYHLATCRMVKNTSEQIAVSTAIELGLQACKICNPPASSVLASSLGKAQGEGETVQCKGTTKTGSRCRHLTRIANGYCFQHQPK